MPGFFPSGSELGGSCASFGSPCRFLNPAQVRRTRGEPATDFVGTKKPACATMTAPQDWKQDTRPTA